INKRKLGAAAVQGRAREAGQARLADRAGPLHVPPVWSEMEEARVRSAVAVIPAEDRTVWFQVGAALHSTGWEQARALFDAWAEKSDKYDQAGQNKLWASFARGYEGQPITLGTLFALAKSYVWEEPPPDEIAELNRRYFVIGNIGGKCLVGEIVTDELGLECLSLQSTHDFKSRYANRKFRFRDGHGNEKWKPLGAAWL